MEKQGGKKRKKKKKKGKQLARAPAVAKGNSLLIHAPISSLAAHYTDTFLITIHFIPYSLSQGVLTTFTTTSILPIYKC